MSLNKIEEEYFGSRINQFTRNKINVYFMTVLLKILQKSAIS